MSAQLVAHIDRTPMPAHRAEDLTNFPQYAEQALYMGIRDSRDGQLWERVAETWERYESTGTGPSHRYNLAWVRSRRFTLSDRSGIIRAGVRVR